MQPTLRPAHPDDLLTVLQWVPTRDLLQYWGGPSLHFPLVPGRVWSAIEADDGNTFSLLDPRCGILGFGQILDKGTGTVHLARIIVSPGYRGRGLGGLLCDALLDHATEHLGATRATLNVYTDNTSAVALYHSLGFTELPEQSRVGNWFMEKCLQG
jgi:ribosomal protein S18 acetylase RimI-like enzyme